MRSKSGRSENVGFQLHPVIVGPEKVATYENEQQNNQ